MFKNSDLTFNKRDRVLGLVLFSMALGLASLLPTQQAHSAEQEQSRNQQIGNFVPPRGWQPPPLNPKGVQLQTKKIGSGVYALLSNKPPVDNSGFIVGRDGVLVIDSHINGRMAQQIINAVRNVSDKPIIYLVNTNAHGDHTFGNHAFPESTLIVAHKHTARDMRHFDKEKALMLLAVGGDHSVLEDVQLRLPDIVFERSMTIDLGDRVVELHHFGHGNTPGDTVVYEPVTKTAWTGNLVLGQQSIPWAIEGQAQSYLETLAKMAARLDIKTIIPGHVLTTTGAELENQLSYLSNHIQTIKSAIRSGKNLEQTLASYPLPEVFLPQKNSALAAARPLMQGFHRWNVKKTYLELKKQARVLK
ncbi:MAG: MBL fold metallo-hydrolase [Methyloligellaceae bacterium]